MGIKISLAAPWNLYTLPCATFDMLGVVTDHVGQTGALGRSPDGLYVRINAGCVHSLDQRRVKASLGISNNAGRPAMDGAQTVRVTLDAASVERAKELGAGNVSAGIRRALGLSKPVDPS